MAIACLRLVTFLPELPLRNVPALRSFITFSTFFWLPLLYFRAICDSPVMDVSNHPASVLISESGMCRNSVSEDSQRQTARHGSAQFFTAGQRGRVNPFGLENFFGRLGVRAHNATLGYRLEAPPGGDPLYLLRGAASVASGADQGSEGPAVDSIEGR